MKTHQITSETTLDRVILFKISLNWLCEKRMVQDVVFTLHEHKNECSTIK